MPSHMPAADADELAQWFIAHMSIEQRRKLMAERPLLYARTFPNVSASTIIARVRSELGAKVELPADAMRVRHGSVIGTLMGWADRDTALVRFAGSDMVVEVPVGDLKPAHDSEPAEPEWPAPEVPAEAPEVPAEAPASKPLPRGSYVPRDEWI